MDARRVFLESILDYAGAFPPAALPVEDARSAFDSYRGGPSGWILGAFVCPVARLGQLAGTNGFEVDAVGRPTLEEQDFLRALQDDVDRVRSCPGIRVRRIETRLPSGPLDRDDLAGLARTVARAVGLLHEARLPGTTLFLEVPLLAPGSDPTTLVPAIAEAAGGAPVGIKLRLGGNDATAVPESASVAAAIAASAKAGLPLKATQGLHRAVRGLDERHGDQAHGFVNVFAAAMLASRCDLRPEQIQDILDDEDAGSFHLERDTFAWNDLDLGPEEVQDARRTVITSFGSCSFSEPIEDLRRLGFLPEGGGAQA